MTYRLVYTHRAIRDIDALDTSVKRRVGKTLLRYGPDPLKHAEPLKQSELGSYRFRIGDYRVVFDLEGGIKSSSCAWGTEEKSTDDNASL